MGVVDRGVVDIQGIVLGDSCPKGNCRRVINKVVILSADRGTDSLQRYHTGIKIAIRLIKSEVKYPAVTIGSNSKKSPFL